MMKTDETLQTIASSYQEICEGTDAWIALGNFLNDFYGNFPDRRQELVAEPLHVPAAGGSDVLQWAVFCAATVEYLCQEYELACPVWVQSYTLSDPWYQSPGAHKQSVRERLERQTPEPFSRRNIYCGNRMFLNKYEHVVNNEGWGQNAVQGVAAMQARSHPMGLVGLPV